jgi:purine-cytosine permease-like protein
VPGKKVKYSVGPRVKADGIMDNWLFYALIAIAAVAGIIAIDYFTSRKPFDEV